MKPKRVSHLKLVKLELPTNGGGEGYSFHANRSSEGHLALASLQCRDGAYRVFDDQTDYHVHQARSVVGCSASRMKGELVA